MGQSPQARRRRTPEPSAPSILVVDDEPRVRGLFRRILEEVGYFVDEAGNGRAALRAIEDKFFDLILLDLSMPDMDGLEFLRTARAALPQIRIVVTSGFAEGMQLTAAIFLGADATLAKPMAREQLLKTVCTVLDDYFGKSSIGNFC